MKLLMSIIALSLFALACSKGGPSTKMTARNLEGTWELRAVRAADGIIIKYVKIAE